MIPRISTGRATGEKEDAEGPSEEAHHLHPPLCKRHYDRRQAEDEPQPNVVNSQRILTMGLDGMGKGA